MTQLLDIAVNSLRPFRFRGKGRLFDSFCPRNGSRRATLFGYTIDLDLEDEIQRNVWLGTYELRETSLVKSHLRKGMTFLDVGANIGYYSLMAAAYAGPSGRVVSFEPSPMSYRHFKKTVDENGILNITIEQAALSDVAGEGQLFVPKEQGNNTPTMVANSGGRAVPVPVVTLDEYLERNRIGRIDFMKIDVEGFEPKVIAGAQSAIRAKRIGAIICEFQGEWLRANGTTPKDFYEFMTSLDLKPSEEPTASSLEWGNILFMA